MAKIKEDCIFCKIANGQIPSNSVYEDEDFNVILDISPASKGHALILPKVHYDNAYEMDEAFAAKVFPLATKLAGAMKKALNCDGLNIVQNNEEAAGQTVFHFHMHLIPRYEGDEVDVTWKQHESVAEEQSEIVKQIQKEL
ncbi:MAG: HIT family protein [Lachnospiraceae bacterium]|nr:HIT family protein [Lachnospiraceae bacterium]